MATDDRRPKRSYAQVAVAPAGEGFGVLLDGRPLVSPKGRPLAAPSRALAELWAEEWERQGERLDLASMTATRLANVALDLDAEGRAGLALSVAAYAASDLVSYLAPEAELQALQEAAWAPVRDWAGEALGLALATTTGALAIEQPAKSLAAARRAAEAEGDLGLVALAHAASLLGSAVLALALRHGRLGADCAFAASRVDESFQEARWGVDAEAAARAERMREELRVIALWFLALGR